MLPRLICNSIEPSEDLTLQALHVNAVMVI
jgi:hypothetical protein